MFTSLNRWQWIGILVSIIWFIGFADYFVQYRLKTGDSGTVSEAQDSCDKALQLSNDVAILIERKEERVARQAENRGNWKKCRDDVREQRRLTVRSDGERILFLLAADLGTITFGWMVVSFGIGIVRSMRRERS